MSDKLTTNLNTGPYHDDFDEKKNYHRTLFRPSYAVQGRELTQIQTYLQDQIQKFGNHIFKDGTIIKGGEISYDTNYNFVKLRDANANGAAITVSDWINKTITGSSSGVKARVVNAISGAEASAPNTNVLFVKYLNSGSNNDTLTFSDGEVITSDNSLSANLLSSSSTGKGSAVTVNTAILYAKGNFITSPRQTVVIDSFDNTPSARIGFNILESIVSSANDSSLLDPASGVSNSNAPGANRLKLDSRLIRKGINSTNLDDFYEIFQVVNGVVQVRGDRTEYSEIRKELARRTYDESGDYEVEPMQVRIREHLNDGTNLGYLTSAEGGDANFLAVGIEPGKVVVRGFDQEKLATTYLKIPKGTETVEVESQAIPANYGNYTKVNEISGVWNVDDLSTLSLRDTAKNSITSNLHSSVAPGTEIGTAKIRDFLYESGTPGSNTGVYRAYLFDISMNSGKSFANVRSLFLNNSGVSNGIADCVLTSNQATLNETSFNSLVFPTAQQAVRRLRDSSGSIDNNFQFIKEFDVTIATDGSFTINTGFSNEVFPFSTGILNQTQKRQNFYVVINESDTTSGLSEGEVIDMGGGSRDITVLSTTSASFDIDATLGSARSATVKCVLQRTDGREIQKTFRNGRYVQIATGSHWANTVGPWNLGISDCFSIQEVRQKGSFFTGTSQGVDVTTHFELDNGQRDNFYEHGKLRKKSDSTLTINSGDFLLVKLQHFTHDTSQGVGYLSVDSYPIDNSNTANTTAITTREIPIYISPTSGQVYNLRNSVDLRPIKTNTANATTTTTNISTNPANSSTFNIPSGGQHLIPANENFTTDLEYYLGRRDKVFIDAEGNFSVSQGIPAINPREPRDIDDAMPLAVLHIPPFPSLAPNVARDFDRLDLQVTLRKIGNRRYTMRDIGSLAGRIEALEYYVLLTALEKEASEYQISDLNGLNRFKNGILVDNFGDDSVSNRTDPAYKAAIDLNEKALRPSFYNYSVGLEYNNSTSVNTTRSSNDSLIKLSTTTGTFTKGEDVFQGSSLASSSARGKLVFVANNSRMYVENRQGTFSNTLNIRGNLSSACASITTIINSPEGPTSNYPYSHIEYAKNPFATKKRSGSGELQFTWKGDVKMSPDTDYFYEIITKPDVQNVVINSEARNIKIDTNLDISEFYFNGPVRQWHGKPVTSEYMHVQFRKISEDTYHMHRFFDKHRYGTFQRLRLEDHQGQFPYIQVVKKKDGKEVYLDIIGYMRSIKTKITITQMKPDTRVHFFFDGENVDQYITPTDSSFNETSPEGTKVITNSIGTAYAEFRIPNDNSKRFRIGTKIFKVTDSSTNDESQETTFAQTKFSSDGADPIPEATIASVKRPDSVPNAPSVFNIGERTNIDGSLQTTDPLSQSFYVREKGGIFLSKIDLYFSKKSSTYPFSIEIREMINGFPGSKIVPLSKVQVLAENINVSSDASLPTPFIFESPVYLKPEQEYAIILKPAGNDPDYVLWVSELGEKDINNVNLRASDQPVLGRLFGPSNDFTWYPFNNEDLKITLYRASFTKDVTSEVILTNENAEYFKVANVSTETFRHTENIHGETRLTISGNTGTPFVGWTVKGNSSQSNGVITNINGSVLRVKDVPTTVKFSTGETVHFANSTGGNTGYIASLDSQTTPTGKVKLFDDRNQNRKVLHITNPTGTWANGEQVKGQSTNAYALINSIDYLSINGLYNLVSLLEVANTNIDWKLNYVDNTGTLKGVFIDIPDNETFEFSEEVRILGRNAEQNQISADKSFQLKGSFTTPVENLSPQIDTERAGITAFENLINNDSTDETNNEGNALVRYITQTVTLADGQDAEDLRIILNAFKPVGTDVEVYYKILNVSDDELFEDRSWVKMDLVTSTGLASDPNTLRDYIEFEYKIPDANLSGPNSEVEYTNNNGASFTGFKYFAVKIVLLSTSTSIVPKVKDLRVLALQV